MESSLLSIKLYKSIVDEETNYDLYVVIALLYYCVLLFSNSIQLRKPFLWKYFEQTNKRNFRTCLMGKQYIAQQQKKRKGAFRLLNEIRYGVNVCCLSPPHFKMQIRFCTALKKMPQKKRHSLSLLILILFSPASLVFPLQGLGSISDVTYFFFYRRCKQQKSDYRYQGLVSI